MTEYQKNELLHKQESHENQKNSNSILQNNSISSVSKSCLSQSNVSRPTVNDEDVNAQPRSDHDISLDNSSHARPENQGSKISEINSGTSSLSIPLTTSLTSDDLDVSCDIDRVFELRTKYYKNPMLAFLNINSLRNKIIDLREIAERCLPDLLLIEET